MKRLIIHCCFLVFISILILPNGLFAQNVGIANTSPTEKLSINGNLLVSAAYSKSNSNPNAQHTHSILAGRADSVLMLIDSVYRILDPGGNGNYLPNIPLSAIVVVDTTGASSNALTGALELTLEFVNLGTGDSVFIVNGLNSSVLFRGGSNMNSATPRTYTGNYLILYFSSNADASVGSGFSAVVRRLYLAPDNPSAGTQTYGNATMFFNARNASLKAGLGNSNYAGFGSIALGAYNGAAGSYSIAIGNSSKALGVADIAMAGGNASGGSSIAIGTSAWASGANSQSFGYRARADGQVSAALTPYSTANGAYSTAIGYMSYAYGINSIALTGGRTEIAGNYATAIGYTSSANKDHSVAIGKNSSTDGISAIAIGEGSRAHGDYAIALGRNTNAYINGAVAIGNGCISGGVNTVAIGTGQAYGSWSTAIGQGAGAGGTATVAIGYNASSNGTHAIAIGDNVSSTGNSSLATGFHTTADGHYSTAMGNYVSTSGFDGAFTIGDNSTTTVMNTFVANGFRARFASGYRLFTNSAASIGAFLNANANSWAALSDVRLKENFIPVDGEDVLKKIYRVPQYTWNYKGQDVRTLRHYGPMAQDFYKAFGKDELGEIGCDTLINQQDFLGVSFIAIQALEKRTQKIGELLLENNELKKQNQSLEKRLEVLEALINRKSLVNQ
jgi:hypothetical protein